MHEITLNEVFREVNECKKRYRALKGSAGSGKSMDVARDYIIKLSDPKYKGANLLCVRKSENSNLSSTYAELYKAVIDIFGSRYEDFWEIKSSPMCLTSKITGNEIIFRGCNDARQIEKIKSITFPHGQLTWIWIEEANEISKHDFEILDDRLRGTFSNPNLYYQITLTLNPVLCWIKESFFDTPSPDVLAHHSTYKDNKFVGDEYEKRMQRRKEQDPEGYRIYGLGEWGEIEGIIFTNWSCIECEKDFEFYDDVCYGQDFGWNHANAILELGYKDGNVYVLRELYVHEKTTSDIVKLANEADFDKNKIMICDSAETDKIIDWKRAGFYAKAVRKTKGVDGKSSVVTQINWLKERHIYIDVSCVNTIEEIKQYHWKKDPITDGYLDEPVKFFDDAMSALRYGVDDWRRMGEVKYTKPEKMSDLQKYRNKRLNKTKSRRYY